MGADLNYDRGVAEAAKDIVGLLDDDGFTDPIGKAPASDAPRDDRGRFARGRAVARTSAAALGDQKPRSEEPAESELGEENLESADDELEKKPEAEKEPADGEEGEDAEAAGGITALADVAKEFGVDEAGFLSAVQVDGADGAKIPLAQVIEEWRGRGTAPPDPAVTQRLQALDQRETQVREREELGLNQLRLLTEQLVATIETEDPVDWKALREAGDPIAYIEARDRAERRKLALEGAIGRLRRGDADRAAQQAEANNRLAQEQATWAKSAVPEWQDRTKAEAAMKQVQDWLKTAGPGRPFAAEEIAQILDARYVITAWKASEYDRLVKAKPAALKKLNGLPKPLRPGANAEQPARGGAAGDPKEVKALRRRLRETGSVQDAARLISRMEI